MAKTSKIVADRRRREVVARFDEQRRTLKATLKDPAAATSEKVLAQRALQRLPRGREPHPVAQS